MNEELSQTLTTTQLWKLLSLDPSITQGSFIVVLEYAGTSKINIIRELRTLVKWGLKECKDFVESTPRESPDLTFSEALDWCIRLSILGAKAKIKELSWEHDTTLCKQIAQHPGLSEELALYLLASQDDELQREVARSPHLSKRALSIAASYQPASFLQNPLLPLLLLEDPNLPQLNGRAISRLISQEEALPMLYSAALHSEEACERLSRGDLTKLPEAVVDSLARSAFDGHKYALANNKATPLWVLEILSDSNEDFLLGIAYHSSVTIKLLEKLSASTNENVVSAVAHGEKAPPELLARLALHKSTRVQAAVAENPKTSPETLGLLLRAANHNIRLGLSKNPSLPATLVPELAKDGNAVRNLAENRNISPEVLMALFQQEIHPNHKILLLQNPKCSLALKQLARLDNNKEVREAAEKLFA